MLPMLVSPLLIVINLHGIPNHINILFGFPAEDRLFKEKKKGSASRQFFIQH